MSNGHAGANCAVVTVSNGIPFVLTKPLHYTIPFFLEKGFFLPKRLPFLVATVGNGSCTKNRCNGRSRFVKMAVAVGAHV